MAIHRAGLVLFFDIDDSDPAAADVFRGLMRGLDAGPADPVNPRVYACTDERAAELEEAVAEWDRDLPSRASDPDASPAPRRQDVD